MVLARNILMQFMMRKINMVAEKDDYFNKPPTTEILITGLDIWRFRKSIQRKTLDRSERKEVAED